MDHCDHLTVGDNESEDFLLEDANSVPRKCITCMNKASEWVDNLENGNNNWGIINSYNSGVVSINGTTITSPDDQMEALEDSPLLIINAYCDGSSVDDFHCHNQLQQNEDKRAWKKLLLASLLCFLFMMTELIGGIIADSLAVMTDAAHLFSDFIGFMISLFSIWIGRKSPTKNMTFGYHRAEVLGAFFSVLTIWLLAIIFAVLAINRLWRKEYDVKADTMILVASLGVLVNIMMGAVLYGFCHNHSHGLSHNHAHTDQNNSNINVRAAAAHVLGDLLQSFGVLTAAVIIKFFPSAKLADPICTLIFSIAVICTTAKVAKDSIWLLLEGSPKPASNLALELKTLPSVKHVHNLHIWTLSPGKDAVAVHLCVDKYCDRDLILKKATCLIRSKFNVISCTIQIEPYNSGVAESCSYCQLPQC